MSLFYTGVGSRETPEIVLRQMRELATRLSLFGYTLRSGGADGADTAFERGVMNGSPHIYLPWRGFNGHSHAHRDSPAREAYVMAASVHPAWHRLQAGARALHARNCHQVLGDDLATPSRFLICWTQDGCEREEERTKDTGGTATAIVLACRHGVPVFNLRNPGAEAALNEMLAR